jgi:hypothetical protein
LLFALTRGVPEPEEKEEKRGRKAHTAKDRLFTLAMKVYGMFSSRRSACDFKDAHEDGYTAKEIPGMSVNRFFENPTFTPILKGG